MRCEAQIARFWLSRRRVFQSLRAYAQIPSLQVRRSVWKLIGRRKQCIEINPPPPPPPKKREFQPRQVDVKGTVFECTANLVVPPKFQVIVVSLRQLKLAAADWFSSRHIYRDRTGSGLKGVALAKPPPPPPPPFIFSDGKIIFNFFTMVTQICHLPHKQGLVIWQYWTSTKRKQTLSCNCCQWVCSS